MQLNALTTTAMPDPTPHVHSLVREAGDGLRSAIYALASTTEPTDPKHCFPTTPDLPLALQHAEFALDLITQANQYSDFLEASTAVMLRSAHTDANRGVTMLQAMFSEPGMPAADPAFIAEVLGTAANRLLEVENQLGPHRLVPKQPLPTTAV